MTGPRIRIGNRPGRRRQFILEAAIAAAESGKTIAIAVGSEADRAWYVAQPKERTPPKVRARIKVSGPRAPNERGSEPNE